jgi:hypothetical protein
LENFVIALSDSTFVGYPFPELLGGRRSDTVVQNVFRIEMFFTAIVIAYSLYFIGLCYLDGTTKRLRLFARGIAIPLFCLTLAFWLKFISEDHIISKIEKSELFQFTIASLVASVLLFAYSLRAKPKASSKRTKAHDSVADNKKSEVKSGTSKDLGQKQTSDAENLPPTVESLVAPQAAAEAKELVEANEAQAQVVDAESDDHPFEPPPLPGSEVEEPVEVNEAVEETEVLLPPLPEEGSEAEDEEVDAEVETSPLDASDAESDDQPFEPPPLPGSEVEEPVEVNEAVEETEILLPPLPEEGSEVEASPFETSETESVDQPVDLSASPLPPPMTDLLSVQNPLPAESLEPSLPLPLEEGGTDTPPKVDSEKSEEFKTNQS